MADVTYRSVRKEFGEVVALKDFSLQIPDGEFVVLVGPSGSGKTTALRLLAGLEAISQGEIRVGQRLVNRVAPQDRDIAMVFQDYALYPQMTVYDNLAFGLKMRKIPKPEIKQLQRQVGTTTVYVTHDQVEALTMGDRVAVMNEGLLEQVGDTRTVYEHPANVFVAGFIGSPGMTFTTLDATRNGGPVTLSRGSMSLVVDPVGATGTIPSAVMIGIRPEHAHVWRDGGGLMGPVDGTVTFVEMLGREALLGVSVGDDQRFTVFADADAGTTIGDRLSFGVERGRLYLFDPETQNALGVV